MNYSPLIFMKITYLVPLFENFDNHFHIDCAMYGWLHP
jgi:hypothetical protein